MAVNIITTANSRSLELVDNDAGSYLLVAEGGYIVENKYNFPAYYHGGGTGVIIVKGTISSQLGGAIYCVGDNGDTTSGGGNQITVSASGLLDGYDGIVAYGGGNLVTNDGMISSRYYLGRGVFLGGDFNSVINHGTIFAATGVGIRFDGDYANVDNTGTIEALSTAVYGTGTLYVKNTGVITGSISALQVSLYNSGTINGTVTSFALEDGASSVQNDGRITGYISLNETDDLVTNTGVVNDVYMGYGDDTVDNSVGTITGATDLDEGADTYTGGDHIDRVTGGADNDTIDLGAGNDVYYAGNTDGKDALDGGDGVDLYSASAATQALTVDLGTGSSTGTVGVDVILNFENLTGGAAADTLTGSDDANRIDGGGGADKIDGGAGNDRLIGGYGTDTITGGGGRDILTGGLVGGSLDSDTFVFANGSSGTTSATRDVITDFTDHGHAAAPFNTGADTIDLHLIDANTNVAGDQAFVFNATKGAAFSGAAGSLIWQQYATCVIVSGDTNGDKVADFSIQLSGTHTLFASDFVL